MCVCVEEGRDCRRQGLKFGGQIFTLNTWGGLLTSRLCVCECVEEGRDCKGEGLKFGGRIFTLGELLTSRLYEQ